MAIQFQPGLSSSSLAPALKPQSAGTFASAMDAAISAVEDTNSTAQKAVSNFISGGAEDLHTVALASQRAEVSMELFQQVRNKLVSAYQEIMRSQF